MTIYTSITAWLLHNKILKAMSERDEIDVLRGKIQIDDAYLGAHAVRKVVAWIFDHGGGDVEVTNAALQRGSQG